MRGIHLCREWRSRKQLLRGATGLIARRRFRRKDLVYDLSRHLNGAERLIIKGSAAVSIVISKSGY